MTEIQLTDKITVINGDCMDVMARYADKHFDLAVVDPPYGIGIGRSVGGVSRSVVVGRGSLSRPKIYRGFDDSQIPGVEYFKALFRVSANQIIWGGNYFVCHLFNTPCFLVWDKNNSGNFADAELAWTSFKTATRIFKYRWNGMLQQNMKNKEERIHPTHKPIALYDWIFKNYAERGMRVLDTHGGSMSSVIAADKAGLEMVCCELDKEYFDKAVDRFRKYKSQMKLEL